MSTSTKLMVRRMLPLDLAGVLAIEQQEEQNGWTRQDFLSVLDSYDVEGRVAEIDGRTAGFAVFVVSSPSGPTGLKLLRLGVSPFARRCGVASALLEDRSHPHGRIRAAIPETHVSAQILLRDEGFKAVKVLKAHYGEEDGYLMERPRE